MTDIKQALTEALAATITDYDKPWHAERVLAHPSMQAIARRLDEADEMEKQLHPIEWWYCVWCETKFPYDDGPDTLKAHSAICEKHPANIARAKDAREAAVGRAVQEAALRWHEQQQHVMRYEVCHQDWCGPLRAAIAAYRENKE
jgi:hypothetical protein